MNSNNILHSLAQKPLTSFVLYTGNGKNKKTKDLSQISAKINEELKSSININLNPNEKKNLRINLGRISDKIKKRNQKVKFVQELKLPIVGCIARCLYRKSSVPPISIPKELQNTNKTSKPISKSDNARNDHLRKLFQNDPRVQIFDKQEQDLPNFISENFASLKQGEASIYLCIDCDSAKSHLIILGKPKPVYDIIQIESDDTLCMPSKSLVSYPDLDSLINGVGMSDLVFRDHG